MALGELLGLRQPKKSGPFEILEGDEFERDLKKRKGGLQSQRSGDRAQIKAIIQEISSGSLNDEQIQATIHRNPGAAGELTAASQTPERQIGQEFFDPGRPEERRGPLVEGATGPEAEGPVQVIPGQEPKADFQGAVMEALSRGRIDIAQNLLEIAAGEGGKKLMKVPGRDDEGNDVTHLVDPTSGNVVKTFRGKTRNLSQSSITKLQTASDNFDRINLINQSFDDRFGGFKSNIAGNAKVEYSKRFGDDVPFVQFWQAYQEQTNLIRKELFGTALTATEKKEFERARINPGMTPKQIRANLKRQTNASLKAAQKLSKPFNTGNFDSRQVRGALGANADTILLGRPQALSDEQPETNKSQNRVVPFSELPE